MTKIIYIILITLKLCQCGKLFLQNNRSGEIKLKNNDINYNNNQNHNVRPATLPFIFNSDDLPGNLKLMPTIGNGHVSFTIFSNSIYLNGLYNGVHGMSHRARIPNWSNLKLTPSSVSSSSPSASNQFRSTYSLNVREGVFQISTENDAVRIEQLIYAHRFYNRLIVNQIHVYRKNANGQIKVKISLESGDETDDILFKPSRTCNYGNTSFVVMEGFTKEMEDVDYQKSGTHVCCVWNKIPEEEELIVNENEKFQSFRYLLAIDNSCSVAQQEILQALKKNNKQLLNSHHDQWKYFWDTIRIETTGNLELGRAIYGSLFYMASALPSIETDQMSNPFFGISPTGLGRGGNDLNDYQGHNFWDTEIWMLPVITQMNPQWTKELLAYRFSKMTVANDNAQKMGYRGARFPWESAFTGSETTNPCCTEVGLLQHHITADIAFGLQHYLSVTYDSEWLQREGCPLATSIAEFWASRVVVSDSSYYDRNKKQQYSIKYVMGPDEDHPNITDNVYTNVVASYALRFGAKFCDKLVPPSIAAKWIDIADNLKILYDSVNDYHPQYEGYQLKTPIKQADAVLLGYPLMFPMADSTRRNDLRFYEEVTRKTGPAMTWTMHAINHLDVGDYEKADELFNQSYVNYVRPPFQVFTEVITNNSGAVNFLTGAGGFLQAVINGYAGVRIFIDRMVVQRPRVTPNTINLTVSGVKYLGSTFEIIASKENIPTIRCITTSTEHPLILEDNSNQYEITVEFVYAIKSTSIIIRPKYKIFKD